MSGPVLVTGAAGALGRATVAALCERGVPVRALVRGADDGFPDGIEVVQGDLTSANLAPIVADTRAVIHAAASVGGTDTEIERDTIRATERLVLAMRAAESAPWMVLAGSMSVYAAGPENGLIEETSELEPHPERRDAYCRAKRAQERAAETLGAHWCLRLGALWGPGRLWNGHIGAAAGPLVVRIGAGEIPLCHLDRAAQALATAAVTRPDGPVVLNVLDDERPEARRYLAALRAGGWPRLVLPLSWRLFDRLAGIAPARAPGLLRREVLRARMMPRRFDTYRATQMLGLTPSASFELAMAAALAATPKGQTQ